MIPPTLIKADSRIFLGPSPDLWCPVPEGTLISLCLTHPTERAQVSFPMNDTLFPQGIPDRAAFEAFLELAHEATQRGPTYWHCRRGINRSGFALAAYLHRYQHQRITAAVARLRRLRSPLVLQNTLFVDTLSEWYGRGVEPTPKTVRLPLPMPEAAPDGG